MKVKLIVVQGKPEGKEIPLLSPVFRIGRGETCHLRPTSELVSREHAEFTVTAETVSVRDLGSRNGTLVNGKALTEACVLKDRDLVQVGALTFAVAITEVADVASKTPSADTPKPAAAPVSPDDVSHDDIESWLVSDSTAPASGRPPGVYGGDTITIKAFKGAASPKPEIPPTADDTSEAEASESAEGDDGEYDRLPEGEGDPDQETQEVETEESSEEIPEEFVDESNPFYVKKSKAPDSPSKPTYKDTSDAASDILRKMMERRRGSK